MKALRTWLPLLVPAVCLTVLLLTSLHAVEEIHYLKTFYPASFSVEEACLCLLRRLPQPNGERAG
jgi:hypothetical protein